MAGVLSTYAKDVNILNEALGKVLAMTDMGVHVLLSMMPEERSYMLFGRGPSETKLQERAETFLCSAKRVDVLGNQAEDSLVVVARRMLEK